LLHRIRTPASGARRMLGGGTFAGWYMSVDLVVRERTGAGMVRSGSI
jgi:hypothetical protein